MKGTVMRSKRRRKLRPKLLAVDAPTAAMMLGISPAHFYTRLAAGQVPPGFHLGRRRLWSVQELRKWIDAGAPCADRWAETNPNGARAARSQMKRQVDHENL